MLTFFIVSKNEVIVTIISHDDKNSIDTKINDENNINAHTNTEIFILHFNKKYPYNVNLLMSSYKH